MSHRAFDILQTARCAISAAVTYGHHWSRTVFMDDLGPTTVYGVTVPALDESGAALGYDVDWAMAAHWPGIETLDDQRRLDLLREVTLAATTAWVSGLPLDASEMRKVEIGMLSQRGTFVVATYWQAPGAFLVARLDWV